MELGQWETQRQQLSPQDLFELVRRLPGVEEPARARVPCCTCLVPLDATVQGVPAVVLMAWWMFPLEEVDVGYTVVHKCGNTRCVRWCHMNITNEP